MFWFLSGSTSCDTANLVEVNSQCPSTQTCVPDPNNGNAGTCDCRPGFAKINETYCKNISSGILPDPHSSSLVDNGSGSSSHVIAAILIPILLISVVISGVYFNRKYDLYRYIRTKFYRRSSNYDEVMIGQDLDDDDPPLC